MWHSRSIAVQMHFVFNWRVTLFSLVCLVLFIYLGFWQLGRAEEKRTLIEHYERLHQKPWGALTLETLPGSPVRLRGRYQPQKVFLLDNRVLKGVVGFEVLTVFVGQGLGTRVVVNRGFVPMGRTRDDKVAIPSLRSVDEVLGHVYIPQDQLLADSTASGMIVQSQRPASLLNDMSVYPNVVRLSSEDPNALPRDWPLTTMLPEKHVGYAVQWFAMAFAVLIAFGYFSSRGKESDD